MKTLDAIACTESTDRSSDGWHGYFETYDEVFHHLRHEPVELVEFGILDGGGIRTWARWFDHPDTRILGVDIELFRYKGCDDPRVVVVEGSQTDATLFPASKRFDIILDDAGHFADQQIQAFGIHWPRVNPGGFYAIEDLHTFRSPQHCSGGNIMHWLAGLTESIQAEGGALAQAKRVAGDTVDWIMIRKGLAIIKKLGRR